MTKQANIFFISSKTTHEKQMNVLIVVQFFIEVDKSYNNFINI